MVALEDDYLAAAWMAKSSGSPCVVVDLLFKREIEQLVTFRDVERMATLSSMLKAERQSRIERTIHELPPGAEGGVARDRVVAPVARIV